MGLVLGPHQYGKAENRVVRIYRDTPRHEIRDVTVSTALRGDFADAHLVGDQSKVLPTDSQKNTCFAYAKEKGIGEVEDYALDLARHFVDDIASVSTAGSTTTRGCAGARRCAPPWSPSTAPGTTSRPGSSRG